MYKALNYWVFGGFGPNRTPYEFIDFAVKARLDGVELTVGDCLPIEIDEAECRKIKAYAKAKKVGLRTLATGAGWGTWLCAGSAAERKAALKFCEKYLQIAAWLGAETVLIVPGTTRADATHKNLDYDVAWKNSVAGFKKLAKTAEKLKVNIGVENVWNHFLFSPIEWKIFLDEIGSKRVGMYFDVGNCQQYVTAADYPKILGKRIKAVHIKNWKGVNGGGDLSGFGEDILAGDVDLKATIAALKKVDAKLPLTAEMIPFCRGAELNIPDAKLSLATCRRLAKLG